MKFINLIFQLLLNIILVATLGYWFTGYNSAFEADQTCHSELSNYSNVIGKFGCDHDTETHKWILYKENGDSKPAEIIKRFRYKFL